MGIQKGESVVVMLENRPEFLMVAGALAKIGAISSLINTNQRDRVLFHSISLIKGLKFIIGEELIDAFEAVKNDLKLSGGGDF